MFCTTLHPTRKCRMSTQSLYSTLVILQAAVNNQFSRRCSSRVWQAPLLRHALCLGSRSGTPCNASLGQHTCAFP